MILQIKSFIDFTLFKIKMKNKKTPKWSFLKKLKIKTSDKTIYKVGLYE